jgi:hypothetical protein
MSDYNDKHNTDLAGEIATILEPAKRVRFEVPPYLGPRVLANLPDPIARKLTVWRWATGVSTAFGLVMAALVVLKPAPESATVKSIEQSYVINVDFEDLKIRGIEHAEVVLPDGVRFVSRKHIHIPRLRTLKIALGGLDDTIKNIPVVVESDHEGRENIGIRLFKDGTVVAEKFVSIDFRRQNKEM